MAPSGPLSPSPPPSSGSVRLPSSWVTDTVSAGGSLSPQTQGPRLKWSDWVRMLLPPGTPLLLLLVVVFLPLAMLTGESLFIPLFEELRLMGKGQLPNLPLVFFVKVLAFLLLCSLAVVQVLFRLEVLYFTAWSRYYPRPHPLHVDYQPDYRDSMISLMVWTFYRAARLLMPPAAFALALVVLSWAEFQLFNTLLANPAFNLPLSFIMGLFFLLLLGAALGISLLYSAWNGVMTLYGNCVAITEPDLPMPTVFDRSTRMALVTARILFLLPLLALSGLNVLLYAVWLMISFNIEDLLQQGDHWGTILLWGFLVFVGVVAYNGYKFFAYHKTLQQYYDRLPAVVKAQFVPPPPRRRHAFQPLPDNPTTGPSSLSDVPQPGTSTLPQSLSDPY